MLVEPPFLKKLPWQSHILQTDIGYYPVKPKFQI